MGWGGECGNSFEVGRDGLLLCLHSDGYKILAPIHISSPYHANICKCEPLFHQSRDATEQAHKHYPTLTSDPHVTHNPILDSITSILCIRTYFSYIFTHSGADHVYSEAFPTWGFSAVMTNADLHNPHDGWISDIGELMVEVWGGWMDKCWK